MFPKAGHTCYEAVVWESCVHVHASRKELHEMVHLETLQQFYHSLCFFFILNAMCISNCRVLCINFFVYVCACIKEYCYVRYILFGFYSILLTILL